MAVCRFASACLVLYLSQLACAIEVIIHPTPIVNPYNPRISVSIPWTNHTTENVKVVIGDSKHLQTIRASQVHFEIASLNYNPTANVEYGILGASGEKTLFKVENNLPLASISHNLYLSVPAGTNIYGAYLNFNPPINAPTGANTEINIQDPVIVANSNACICCACGDYNYDYSVDAADYVFWRDTGSAAKDYQNWQAHFGNVISSGTALGAIPEPSTLFLTIAALAALGTRRRRLLIP